MDDSREHGNAAGVEELGIKTAIDFAEAHWHTLCTTDSGELVLTDGLDARIYASFRSNFPEMDVEVVTDDDLKNDAQKSLWQLFMSAQEGVVSDFNILCLLRSDAKSDYCYSNTLIVPRFQFYCIEIARNRECCNIGLQTTPRKLPVDLDGAVSALLREIEEAVEAGQKGTKGGASGQQATALRLLRRLAALGPLSSVTLKSTGAGLYLNQTVRRLGTPLVKAAAGRVIRMWRENVARARAARAAGEDLSQTEYDSGMVHHHDPESAVVVWAHMGSSAVLYAYKTRVLALQGHHPVPEDGVSPPLRFVITPEQPLPTPLLTALRVQRASLSELDAFVRRVGELGGGGEGGSSGGEEAWQAGALDEASELAALHALRLLLQRMESVFGGMPSGRTVAISLNAARERLHAIGVRSDLFSHDMPEQAELRNRGVHIAGKEPPPLTEFERDMIMVLPALEARTHAALAALRHEGKVRDEDAVFAELYRQGYSADALRITTAIGVQQQMAGAVDPSEYASDRVAKLLSKQRVEEFLANGLLVVDDFISPEEATALNNDMLSLEAGGWLQPTFQADVDTRFDSIRWITEDNADMGDLQRPALASSITLLKGIANELVAKGGLSLAVPALCMAACYDGGGAHYVAHRDNECVLPPRKEEGDEADALSDDAVTRIVSKTIAGRAESGSRAEHRDASRRTTHQCHNTRAVTAILYPNPSWREEDGGALRCYLDAHDSDGQGETAQKVVDVLPQSGRLVLFWSREMLHEVMPAFRKRMALSLWILDSPKVDM